MITLPSPEPACPAPALQARSHKSIRPTANSMADTGRRGSQDGSRGALGRLGMARAYSEAGQQRYVKEAKKYNVEIPTIALNLFCDRGMTGNYNMDFAKDVVSNAINMAVNMFMGAEK